MASTVGGRIHGSGRYQGPQLQQPPGDAQRRLPELALAISTVGAISAIRSPSRRWPSQQVIKCMA